MAKFKPNGIIPEIRASCAEEPPLWASATAAFEDDAVGLVLGAIGDQESDDGMKRDEQRKTPFLKNPKQMRSEKKRISL